MEIDNFKHSVLFVCAANICRSPMAMGLLRSIIDDQEENWIVESAGVWALENQPAARYTQSLLNQRGVDLSKHSSKLVTFEMVDNFNLILVMERNQKEALRTAFPKQAPKIFMLSEMVGETDEIVDPIGGTLSDFKSTAQEIDHILKKGFIKISRLSTKSS